MSGRSAEPTGPKAARAAVTPDRDGVDGTDQQVSAVFFDAGETLLAPEPSFARRIHLVVAEQGETLEEAAIATAFATVIGRVIWPGTWGDEAAQRAFWTGFYTDVLAQAGARGDHAHLAGALYESLTDPANYKLFPDTLPVLDDLAGRGLTLGVVSNWEPWLAEVLRLQRIHDRFATVAVSGVLGVSKPDPAIFHAALAEAGVTASETVYVGDSPTADVEGALAAGLRPVLLDRHGRFPDGAGAAGTDGAPVPRITTLTELLPLLPAQAGGAGGPGGAPAADR
jgi:putative hydrolase of the HAD superfamily